MSQSSVRKGIALFFLITALASLSLTAQTITLSPSSGPPTTALTVSGSGFPPAATIQMTFDAIPRPSARSDASGAFQANIHVPASAQPGYHTVTAKSGTAVLATTKFLVRTDWSQFGFSPAGTRWNPHENTLSVSTAPMLTELWSTAIAPRLGFNDASPVVVNGVVYSADEAGNAFALNASTGAKLWRFRLAAGFFLSSPAVANGLVYVASTAGDIFALNARTGAVVWSGSGIGRLVVANGVVYVDGGLYGAACPDGRLCALDASTGALLWSFAPPMETGPIYVGPVANGVVYPVRGDGVVYALNASSGAMLWSFQTGGSISYSMPTVANGVVYVGTDLGNEYALNASTGALLWSFGNEGTSSAAVADGVVYVSSLDNNLYALNASTGALLWSFAAGNEIWSSPAVANGVVYVSSGGNGSDNNVYALDASTGAKLWSFAFGGGFSPTVVNGVVYVGGYDGKVYAFGLPPAALAQDDGVPEEH